MKVEFLRGSIHINKYYTNKELFEISHKGHSFDSYYDSDYKRTVIDRYNVNPKTANIELTQFVIILALLYDKRPFTTLKFDSHYEKTEKEVFRLMKDILSK